ncbi:hypothetical protein Bca4012_040787 [Brassica carinata]
MDSDSLLPLSDSLELPVIDFSNQNLAPGTSKWDEVKDDVRKAETMHKFSERSVELDVMARRMIMESFGIEKYLDEHLNSTYYVLRLMKYTSAPDDDVEETKVGLLSHTDKSITTILHQYEVDGLEIKTKDEKWIKVKPSQHCFIIMVGDFLCALLNGRLYSPRHRVLMTANKTRYSSAMFSVPKPGVIIDSPEELVDEEHPRMFIPFEYNEFINFFHSEAGRKAESALHAFCAL